MCPALERKEVWSLFLSDEGGSVLLEIKQGSEMGWGRGCWAGLGTTGPAWAQPRLWAEVMPWWVFFFWSEPLMGVPRVL